MYCVIFRAFDVLSVKVRLFREAIGRARREKRVKEKRGAIKGNGKIEKEDERGRKRDIKGMCGVREARL